MREFPDAPAVLEVVPGYESVGWHSLRRSCYLTACHAPMPISHAVVQAYQSPRRIIPGIGHPLHKPVDPRTARLFDLTPLSVNAPPRV